MQYFLLLALLAADAPRPNVIVFNVDDMGYADVGCFGSKLNRTPNVDRLAAEGMKLTCFYAAPVCSPSRAAMMTGCYPKRVGIPQVLFPGNTIGINAEESTLAELLKAQGYATICIGKWHLGDQPEFLPTRHGFDHYFGLPYSNDMGPAEDGARAGIGQPKAKNFEAKQKRRGHPPLPLLRDEKVVERVYAKEQATLTRRYTEEAVKFIREQTAGGRTSPFFLYLPHTAVHVPLYPGDDFKGKSPHGIYSDWVEEVDWSLGQVVDAVRAAGIAERTLVIFTSDNGGTPRAVNAPLRGFKGSTLEGGMREPTVVWWPGKIAAGLQCDAVTSNMDLVPTLTKLAGGTLPEARKLDGHDIWPLLSGQTKETPYEAFYYFQANRLNAVRSGAWKLELASGKLYNLETDIGEATDVAAANPAVVENLQALADKAKADLGGEGAGPGCRPPGRVENARPIIDHEGNVRPGSQAPGSQAPLGNPRREAPLPGPSKQSFGNVRAQAELGHEKASTPGPGLVPAMNKPNIVLLLADDMGYGDLGCYGCPDIKTPHLDALARQGVRMTSFYSNGPECTPTRAGLMTGRYQARVGGLECALGLGNVGRYDDAIRLAEKHELGLPPSESVLARQLKDAGYATAICGKWHLGYERMFLPRQHGFDYFFGPLGGAVDYFRHTEPGGELMLYRNEEPLRRDGYLTDLLADEAIKWLQTVKDQPFFLYVPFTAPHSPFQAPGDRTSGPFSADDFNRGTRADYVKMVERLDDRIGAILRTLDELKLSENTLVIFASDNGGPALGRNEPFSGRKGTTYEGGIRVPCILRWPGKLAPGESDQVAITMDLTASILRRGGAAPLPSRPLDGIDIIQLHQRQANLPRTLFWRQRRGEVTWRGVRDGVLKLVSKQDSDTREDWLFDLAADPAEKSDLLKTRPADVQRLQALLAQWEKEVQPTR